MLWHSPLPTSTHQFIHCNIYKTQRITLNNINRVMLPIIVHFKARNSSWVMPKNHLPLSMKVVILRCQYFGLDRLLPVSVGSSCRQEICSSFPPSLGLAVRLPGCFLCVPDKWLLWLQDVQIIAAGHSSPSCPLLHCMTLHPLCLAFHDFTCEDLLSWISTNFKLNLLQICRDSSSTYNTIIW